MAATNKLAFETLNSFFNGKTLKCMLLNSSYTLAQIQDFNTANEISGSEIAVTGYTGGYGGAGRKALASVAIAEDDVGNRGWLDAADLTWTALGTGETITQYAIVIEDYFGATGNDIETLIVGIESLSSSFPTNGSDFQLQFAANGIIEETT